ncbi:hypothetical protein F2P81_010018 [Scophthalmus maximus]|uniref:Formin-binding protein 1-like n=1 Tax=Scophthalmus maximus TaxID=52904 RepID=A0A6A4T1K4_SCOMX|nr:hypothetical protein F2P81_010018 [Scophthalmus maximus]
MRVRGGRLQIKSTPCHVTVRVCVLDRTVGDDERSGEETAFFPPDPAVIAVRVRLHASEIIQQFVGEAAAAAAAAAAVGWLVEELTSRDQYDVIDKHTQSGLDLVDRYIKFVKERTEIEQSYAKQLRFSNHASFQEILYELNDYAGQRELIAENMMTGICVELTKYIQDLKLERKTHLSDAKKAQQTLEGSFKSLESEILYELNDYAGQRELIAENMMTGICVELTKYIQDLKLERKTHLSDAKKAQQTLEGSFKSLESEVCGGCSSVHFCAEDFSHLPPEQRKKRLQAKIDEISKELQKTQDQSDALEKMKGVYERNPQMGDPSSLEPQITETTQNIGRLRGELAKYESWLSEAVGGEESANAINNNTQHGVVAANQSHNIYTEFEDEFDDVESPIGQCTALYTFEGNSEGTISVTEGEMLSIMEEDKGDGWMRVLRASGEEGYIPSNTEEKTEKTISSVDSVEQQSVYSVVIMLMMSLLVPEEPPASEYIRNAVKVNGCKILG